MERRNEKVPSFDLKYFSIAATTAESLLWLSECSVAGDGGGDSIKFKTGANFKLHFRICHWAEHVIPQSAAIRKILD